MYYHVIPCTDNQAINTSCSVVWYDSFKFSLSSITLLSSFSVPISTIWSPLPFSNSSVSFLYITIIYMDINYIWTRTLNIRSLLRGCYPLPDISFPSCLHMYPEKGTSTWMSTDLLTLIKVIQNYTKLTLIVYVCLDDVLHVWCWTEVELPSDWIKMLAYG